MAGIWNINSTYNVNSKKIFSKLNFEFGQIFLAKMIKVNDNSTVLLRMLDGWQFSAQIPKQSEISTEGLTKFSVQGLQDGKLLLKVERDNSNEAKKNIDHVLTLLNNEDLGVDKDNYDLLKNMIKHNLPLSHENISKVKTIIDFINKTKDLSNLENKFIDKYIISKNMDKTSIEGKVLKNFFSELKGLNIDDILTLLENGVEINEKSLKSYNTIFKGEGSLYKNIQNIKAKIGKLNIEPLNNLQVDSKEIIETPIKEGIPSLSNKQDREVKNIKIVQNLSDVIVAKREQKIELSLKNNEELKLGTVANIKEQITVKTQDMKTVIKALLEISSNGESESYDKIIQTIKNNISDFKVFNSVSNQYYFLDIPITKGKYEHRLKLIIKDQREKGKKIDTSNCKIAASISTETMDVVDAYIKINSNSMEIDLKCFEPFIKDIYENKENLLNELAGIGYNVHVNVNQKIKELTLSNCSSFFEDNYFSNIDVKV